jgi:hypothetical protein
MLDTKKKKKKRKEKKIKENDLATTSTKLGN